MPDPGFFDDYYCLNYYIKSSILSHLFNPRTPKKNGFFINSVDINNDLF